MKRSIFLSTLCFSICVSHYSYGEKWDIYSEDPTVIIENPELNFESLPLTGEISKSILPHHYG